MKLSQSLQLLFVFMLALAHGWRAGALEVATESGLVRGLEKPDHHLFLGVPYGESMGGAGRWLPLEPVRPWTEVREANMFGSICPQQKVGQAVGDDNCLFLNVTIPIVQANETSGEFPVMVWIHGGAHVQGAGSEYGAELLAVKGRVVVVTLNYRLGAFGFASLPGFSGSGGRISAETGLEDQQAALRWVQRNIKNFGGDPKNVTLFGESAGGIHTCLHLVSPKAKGLFHKVIMQSGSCATPSFRPGMYMPTYLENIPAYRDLQSSISSGEKFAEKVGCKDPATQVQCLQNLDNAKLLKEQAEAVAPVAGGSLLPEDPLQAISRGSFNKVPIIYGTTRDEHQFYHALYKVLAAKMPKDEKGLEEYVRQAVGEKHVTEVLSRYPLTSFPSVELAWIRMVTDSSWACPSLELGRTLSKYGPVWAFEFADDDAPPMVLPMVMARGPTHGSELAYLFKTPVRKRLKPKQIELSDQMIRYWSEFARTGNPQSAIGIAWPKFSGKDGHVQNLAPDDLRSVSFSKDHQCDLWLGLK